MFEFVVFIVRNCKKVDFRRIKRELSLQMLKDFVLLLFGLHSFFLSLAEMLTFLKIIAETLFKDFDHVFHGLHVVFVVKKHSDHGSRVETAQKQDKKRVRKYKVKIIRKLVNNEANYVKSKKKAKNQVNINECRVLFLLFIDLINHNVANIEMVAFLNGFFFCWF